MHRFNLYILIFIFSTVFGKLDLPDKHPLDQTEIKTMVLENGLKVILVSNPKYNISAASMNVKVGSLSDPADAQGLAHFLEHMLFLGTEKYPDVEDYKMYLSNNGGYSNAYTAEDHTNYLFEVIHEAYEGALDRFSQFFISPAFNPEYTKREINAVNSEFQKNLEHDYWRMRQIKRTIYDKGHPANHFEIGSLQTLESVDRQVLLDFHKKYYSANQMSLALLSNYAIVDMELWVKKYFSDIENSNAPDITYPPVYLSEKEAIRLIKVKPIKDKKELALEFPLPIDLYRYYDSKPMSILGSLMGHEGKGSLLSFLKDKGLATGLSGGGSPDTPDYGSAGVWIQLTDEGVQNYQKVLEYFFSYVDMLKIEGYKDHLFYEQQTIAKLQEVYSDKGEGAWKAIDYANNLANYPMDIAHRVEYHYGAPDSKAYMRTLSFIRPDNMLCVLSDANQETPLEEFWYKSKYNYEEILGVEYSRLKTPVTYSSLHLPEVNPYLPNTANLLNELNNESQHPIVIENSTGMKLYFGKDAEFQRPKASYNYKIYFSGKYKDLKSQTLIQLFVAAVNESMNEASYPAKLAGMSFMVSSDVEGLNISINGYSDSIDDLLLEIINNLNLINIPDEQFNAMKAQMIRDWNNLELGDAYRIAREQMRKISKKYYYTNIDFANSAKNIVLKDVKKFGKKLMKRGYVEGLVYGNVVESQAKENTNLLISKLNIKPISKSKTINQGRLMYESGEKITSIVDSKVNNSCLWRTQYFGMNTVEDEAQAKVIGNFIGSPFYLEMRTNQQLGYIVWGGGASFDNSSYFYYIIQSGDYTADYLQSQADAFIVTLPDSLMSIDDSEFNIIKNGVIEKIKEKPTSIAEQANKYFSLAFDYDGNFNRDEQVINAINALTKDTAVKVLNRSININTIEQTTILLYAKEHNKNDNVSSTFEDIKKWKINRTYR